MYCVTAYRQKILQLIIHLRAYKHEFLDGIFPSYDEPLRVVPFSVVSTALGEERFMRFFQRQQQRMMFDSDVEMPLRNFKSGELFV